MAAPAYRIGPSDFFTPGDLQSDADTLDGQIRALDAAIDGNDSIPQDQWDQFAVWMSSWKKFYSSSFGSYFTDAITALNDANRDQLIQFENAFQSWVSLFAQSGVTFPGAVIQPSQGSGDTLGAQLNKQLEPVAKTLGISAVSIVTIAVVLVVVLFVVRR